MSGVAWIPGMAARSVTGPMVSVDGSEDLHEVRGEDTTVYRVLAVQTMLLLVVAPEDGAIAGWEPSAHFVPDMRDAATSATARLAARTAEWKHALGDRDEANARAKAWRDQCLVSTAHCREAGVRTEHVAAWLTANGWSRIGWDPFGWDVWVDSAGDELDLWRKPCDLVAPDDETVRSAMAIAYIAGHVDRPEHDILDEVAELAKAMECDAGPGVEE